jgi:heat shock protein HslJ
MRIAAIFILLLSGCAKNHDATADKIPAPIAPAVTQGLKPAESKTALAGSSWQLVAFQSMDDAIGSQSPDDPTKYTLQLNADGTAQMQLNCNRANGSWASTPAADGQSGQFSFGPLASTRALCPPPSMDEQIGEQSQYISAYMIKDGRLFLSLMADGGVYEWQPLDKASAEIDKALESAILKASPDYTQAVIGDSSKARYVVGKADLNEDGRPETLVYLMGSIFCGTGGCTLLVFDGKNGSYQLIEKISLSRTPVIVSSKAMKGWRDIWQMQSGGGAPAEYVSFRFNGKHYAESEHVPAANAPEGFRVFPENTDFSHGLELLPLL